MATTWIVFPARLVAGAAVLGAVALVGCGKPADRKTDPKPESGKTESSTTTTPPPPATPPAGADDAAKAILTDLAAGKADPARLSTGFKQLIAPPSNDADKALGYSEWGAEQYLKSRVAGKAGALKMTYAVATDVVVAVTENGFLKLAKGPAGWLVDWVHVGPAGVRNWPTDPTGSAFATAAFLDTALTDQTSLAEAVLSPAVKARLAPPLDDVDRARGYNRGILKLKISGFHGSASDYKIERFNSTETTGKLSDGRAFTVKLVKGSKPGEWLVNDFQSQ